MEFQDTWFDVVYDVSAIEHFGLAGRYGVAEYDPDGDQRAVAEIYRVTKMVNQSSTCLLAVEASERDIR